MRYLREEGKLLADGVEFPQLATRFRDRHALVVARGPGYKRDLRMVRPYVRDFKPVLIAVDGGADALLEAGYMPDVIVGDMDSVSDAALRSGAELLVHGYRDGLAPGEEPRARAGRRLPGRPRDRNQRGHRPAARVREGLAADRRRRHALQPDRVPGAEPLRDVVDVHHATQGGGDPDRRQGSLPARQSPGGPLAAHALRARRPGRDRGRDRRVAALCGI